MKRLSLQWRITLLTALLIACACVCMNLLLYRTGATGMDALNGFMMQYQPGSEDSLTIEIPQEEMSSLLAHFSQEVYDAKVVFGRKGWCITAVVTILSAAIAYFVSGRALKPLQQLAQQAQRVDQDSIATVRLDEDTVQEFGQLSRSVNRMLDGLAQSFELQRQFAGNAAHELRTPLTAIGGWSETLLAGGGEDPEEVMQGLTIIQKEAGRLTRMVEELLDFARIESGRMKLEVELFDLSIELYEAVYMYENLLQKSGIRLSYDEDVDANYYINGDRHRMKQVFLNILDNAAKYGADGKKIDISLRREGGKIVASVRDYGQGIPEAELPFVKEKFYKGSSKQRGSGIGLAVTDEIVVLHGGTLDIASTLGAGTTVTITLPAAEAEEALGITGAIPKVPETPYTPEPKGDS